MEVHNAEVCEVFGCRPSDDDATLARAVIYKGRDEISVPGFGPGAVEFLVRIANEIAVSVHHQDRHVDVPKRIEAIVRNALNYCDRMESPAILLALNPKARLPHLDKWPSILEIHQLARMQVVKELAPFVAAIFQSMINYGHVKDSSRTFHSAYN